MNDSKPFWASKTLWAAVIAGIGLLLPNLGLGNDPDMTTRLTDSWLNFLNDGLVLVGLIGTVVGRLAAKKTLSKT